MVASWIIVSARHAARLTRGDSTCAQSGRVFGEAIELLQIRLDAKKEPGHFPSKGTVARVHPRCRGDLFGEVHDPGLKPEGLVEAVSNLAEVLIHDLLLHS